jgi:hypothetical protein
MGLATRDRVKCKCVCMYSSKEAEEWKGYIRRVLTLTYECNCASSEILLLEEAGLWPGFAYSG